jgi:diguanylate cyclase (GGDEF)-like protein
MPPEPPARVVPFRALAISLGAFLVPVLGAFSFPERIAEYGALLWLTMVIPAFLLAYHRGWRGAATALAAGMATLSVTQAAVLWAGEPVPDILLGVVVAYVLIVLGIGWLAEALHQERAVVEDMAFTDLLTGLPNRRQARLFLENEFAAAERGRTLSAVIFDLDHFKEYNDQHGHPAGDDALRAFADILGRTTRRADLSARFGGEEFLSVLTASDAEGAVIFGDRIRTALGAAHLDRGSLTVSAGAAAYHPGMRSPDELLAAADDALYQAKREGRDCVRLYGSSLMDHVRLGRRGVPRPPSR